MAFGTGIAGYWKKIFGGHQLAAGIVLGGLIFLTGLVGMKDTSRDHFCVRCHVHPQADSTWQISTHYKNKSGVVIHCVQCHLPPGGWQLLKEKARLGIRDVYGYWFKDTDKIDWEEKSALYNAVTYTFDSACLHCHAELYSEDISAKGVEAHRHYDDNRDKVFCINCHKSVGHYAEQPVLLVQAADSLEAPRRPVRRDVGKFSAYTEKIPGTDVTFELLAIPGGSFRMGSPEDEACRRPDEGPVHEVTLSAFWIGETEVTWNEYQAYFDQMGVPARKDSTGGAEVDTTSLDATTGPTPKYGSSDIGGWSTAYSMTHYAATRYCEWLSEQTGKHYRLPTEAEWEYCARAGTDTPYFFSANPARLTGHSLRNRLFGTDDGVINRYIFFIRNSRAQVHNPYTNEPNPWGLYDMLGNVREFCRDYYSADAYWQGLEGAVPGLSLGPLVDPQGPPLGTEHVVRGGSYLSDPADCRAAARGRTHHDQWLVTDPHKPKSRWWYSDCMEVGFRVVRELDGEELPVSAGSLP